VIHTVLAGFVLIGSCAAARTGDAYKIRRLNVRCASKIEAKGETLDRLKRAYGRLCSPPLNDIEFVLSDVSFRYTRRFTNYSGDISGRMLGALNACDAVLGAETPFIGKLIAGFKKHQKPDGHFGAEQDLDKEVNQQRDMALLWGNGRLLLALAERLRRKPDAQVRRMAIRLGDYVISTRKYYGKPENFKGVGGIRASGFTTCYPSLIDGLAALAEATGEKRFLREARFIGELSLLDLELKKHHSHGRLTAHRGMIDVDRIAGTKTFLSPLAEGRGKILDEQMMPTGGVDEYFDPACNRDEGCSEADWLRVNLFTWPSTGENGAIDVAEHVLRNHLYATQFSNGGFGHRVFRRLRDGSDPFNYGGIDNTGSESYWCCSMHGAQILAEIPWWGVVAVGNRIMITWLAEVRATIVPGKDLPPLTVTTTQSSPGSWTVMVEAPKPTQATLALRVPRSNGSITVDGKRIRGRGPWADFTGAGGWVNVTRTWSGKSTLKVELPIDVRLETPYDSQPKGGPVVCVLSGPDLYCLPDVRLADGLVPPDVVPSIVLSARVPDKGVIHVLVEGKEGHRQSAKLVPMASRPPGAARWLFRARRVDDGAFKKLAEKARPAVKPGTPVELELGCDGHFDAYLNGKLVARRSGCGECPQIDVYSKQASNVLAIKAWSKAKRPALIGLIRAAGRQHATSVKGWSVTRVGDKVPGTLLTDLEKGLSDDVKVVDVGPFGMPPWNHIAAEFMHSGARWIWAEGKSDPAKPAWLFRYRFDLPGNK